MVRRRRPPCTQSLFYLSPTNLKPFLPFIETEMYTLFKFVHSATFSSIPPSFERTDVPRPRKLISAPSICNRRPSSPFPAARRCSGEESYILEVEVGRERTLKGENKRKGDKEKGKKIILYSLTPFPLLFLAVLPGAETVRSVFGPLVELVKTWNLLEWLVHWGHPGNMAVVLFAMGCYGSYLGFRIRLSKDAEEKAMAKDLHPKLLAGVSFFFALGAIGGIIALLASDKPILESPHAVSGLMGLSLLTIQTILPVFFEDYPGLRTVHGLLGSSIMTLFLIHAALGLQLGLSF